MLQGLFENGLMTGGYVADMLDGRRTVELAAVRAAAIHRTDDDLLEIAKIIAEEKKDCTIPQRVKFDVAFHHTLAKASHNFVYSILLKSFENIYVALVTHFYENNYDREYVYDTHEQIFEAIKNKNADDAEKYLAELLSQGEYIVKTTMNKEG